MGGLPKPITRKPAKPKLGSRLPSRPKRVSIISGPLDPSHLRPASPRVSRVPEGVIWACPRAARSTISRRPPSPKPGSRAPASVRRATKPVNWALDPHTSETEAPEISTLFSESTRDAAQADGGADVALGPDFRRGDTEIGHEQAVFAEAAIEGPVGREPHHDHGAEQRVGGRAGRQRAGGSGDHHPTHGVGRDVGEHEGLARGPFDRDGADAAEARVQLSVGQEPHDLGAAGHERLPAGRRRHLQAARGELVGEVVFDAHLTGLFPGKATATLPPFPNFGSSRPATLEEPFFGPFLAALAPAASVARATPRHVKNTKAIQATRDRRSDKLIRSRLPALAFPFPSNNRSIPMARSGKAAFLRSSSGPWARRGARAGSRAPPAACPPRSRGCARARR